MADLAVFYEHPQWFEPLFAALDRRGVAYVRLPIADHLFDPADRTPPAPIVFNRLAMSSILRQEEHAIFYSQAALAHWELCGARVVNGSAALRLDTSKARQLSLLQALGLETPATRVVHRRADLVRAAAALRFPVMVKANIGGAGAGIARYDTPEDLAMWADDGTTPTGVDGVALVQEYVPARDGKVIRCETLDGRFLYALEITGAAGTFDLCPADACSADRVAAGAPVIAMRAFQPPPEIVVAVERIARAAHLDVGGVEYMIDDRDGAARFYDINALSNFVADPLTVLGYDPHEPLVDYLQRQIVQSVKEGGLMRYGFWAPVFGGWLRNVPDEGMEASWPYMRKLLTTAERIGYDLTLIAELNLNDIKGVGAPAMDAWSTAAAAAAVTERLELMVAVRPNFHQPALFAKAAANIDRISNGRLSLNVVSSWWAQEAQSYGLPFDQHDDRYGRTSEWLDVVNGLWTQDRFTHDGPRYQLQDAICEPKPVSRPRPTIYAGGESEAAKTLIARQCDAFVMHGDPPEAVAPKIADMRRRREDAGLPPMRFGMAAYAIVRDSAAEAQREVERITTLDPNAPGFENFGQWVAGTELERELKVQEYSVSNRGLRANLVGTPEHIEDRVQAYADAGVDLLLLQMSPQQEEMERFSAQVIRPKAPAVAA